MFDDEERPLVSPHLQVQDNFAFVALSASKIEVTFAGKSADIVRSIVPRMAGKLTVGQIRRQAGLSRESFAEFFGELAKEGYMTDIGTVVRDADINCRLENYFRICDAWALEIFERPFWRIFRKGHATQEQVLGWGSEFYHRTVGADEHNSMAVKHCRYKEMRHGLKKHFQEERGHGEIFLRGLGGCGIKSGDLLLSTPLPTTKRLIRYMTELARQDSWGYLGCYGILHSPRTGQTREAVSGQFHAFSRLYPQSKSLFDAFLEHTLLDLGLEHEKIFLETLVRTRNHLSENEAYHAILGAWGMTLVFSSFFDGILDHY
jgi:pyrroloquinoline quinone (PQQ) biosynthesis protein C